MLARLPLERRIALKSWLKRWHHNDWMRDQDEWLEDACLMASCQSMAFPVKRILYCAKHGLFCYHPFVCRRCNLDQRVEPVLDEYGDCFPNAPYWYAAVFSTKVRPDQAYLHFGDFRHQIYQGAPDGFPLRTDWEVSFQRLCGALFEVVRILNKFGVIGGAFCHLELHLSIWPDDSPPLYDWWSGLSHSLHPHLHVLFNMPIPMTAELATAIYDLLDRNLVYHGAQLGYPHLWLKPVTSQSKLDGWLRYSLKSWPLTTWYRRAIKRGCDRWHVNLLFDEIVFDNMVHLAGRVVSPRKVGNMNCQVRSRQYIGAKPPMKLTRKQVSRWLKNKAFAAQHPDWEESVFHLLEKWEKRQGRGHEDSTERLL